MFDSFWPWASDLAREAERNDRRAEDAERHAAVLEQLRGTEGRQAQADLIIGLIEKAVCRPWPRARWWSPWSWYQRDFEVKFALNHIRTYVDAYHEASVYRPDAPDLRLGGYRSSPGSTAPTLDAVAQPPLSNPGDCARSLEPQAQP